MNYTSTKVLNTKLWIEKVINSCSTQIQLSSADRLIWNFKKQLTTDEEKDLARELLVKSYIKSIELGNGYIY